jgi:hypothetical protein
MKQGIGATSMLSPRAGTPVAGFRSPYSPFPGSKDVGSDEYDNEDDDGEMSTSVISTEPGSETNSLGSLTSVE